MDSQLRQRQKGGDKSSSNKEKSNKSSANYASDQQDDDDEPRVPAATSAFSSEEDALANNDIAGPVSQLMEDDNVIESSSTDAATSSRPINGSRLNLPPHLRELFEKKRAELLEQYPDIMTRDMSAEMAPERASIFPRLDVMVFLALLFVMCWLLRAEYNIDVIGWAMQQIHRMLDPGPIQRDAPIDEIEAEGDSAIGRAAMEAAIKAIKTGVAKVKLTTESERA